MVQLLGRRILINKLKKIIKILNRIGKLKNLILTENQILIFTTKGYLLSFNPKDGFLNYYKYLMKGGFGSILFLLMVKCIYLEKVKIISI